MRNVSSTAAYRRRTVHQIELCLLMVKYGLPILLINSVINFFLDCCGVGMIV